MKTFKFLMPFMLAVLVFAGCDTDDLRNDIDDLKNRVESLEAQVASINENMNALRVLIDGNKTISSYTYDETTGAYTLTLSDGSVITLTQGVTGTVNYPSIGIDENGYWTVNGESLGQQAVGQNGATPEFRIEESTNYWQVKFGTGEWQYVVNSNGENVQATTETINTGDQFFKSVEAKDGYLVVVLNDENSQTLKMPIVDGLTCEIVTEGVEGFSGNVLSVAAGTTVKLNVNITGDNRIVTAPNGWIATLSEPVDGKAELSLTAPASASASTFTRATADNTKDVVVQANKGINWAVDKIQVQIGDGEQGGGDADEVTSYYEKYNNGETITIAGIDIKKSDWDGVSSFVVKSITSTGNGTDDNKITQNGIYFVQPGAIAIYAYTGAVTNMFILRDNSSDKTAVLKMNEPAKLNNNTDPTNSKFLCEGLNFDASEATNYQFTANGNFGNMIFRNCSMKFSTAKSVVYISTDKTINSVIFENCKINLTGRTEKQIFNIQKTKLSNISLINNIFYAENNDVETQIFNFGTSSDAPSLTMKNNTFVNVVPQSSGFVNCKSISNISVENNLFYSSNYKSNQLLFRYVGDNGDGAISTTGVAKNNYGNKGTKIWKLFYSNYVIDGGEQINNKKEKIFSNMDFENAVFTPVDELSNCGATIK